MGGRQVRRNLSCKGKDGSHHGRDESSERHHTVSMIKRIAVLLCSEYPGTIHIAVGAH
jgi:hypothetical protein